MLTLCDEILMFWDGNSKASRENLEEGVKLKKLTKAVLRPFEVKKFNIKDTFQRSIL